MIHGIGVDIVRIERMAGLQQRYGERARTRILHPAEREGYDRARDPVNYLAKSWAAKEAFVKAWGTGFRGEISWPDAGVVRDAQGKPSLVFSERLQAVLDAGGISGAHLSLSDEADLVCAMVLLEK